MKRALLLLIAACQGGGASALVPAAGSAGSGSAGSANAALAAASHAKGIQQIPLPDALRAPPADALTSPEGIRYKKLVTNDAGAPAKRNDILLVNYTGWKLPSGETFFTTMSRGQPMPVSLAQMTPGFTEALMLLHKGEKADVWVPPEVAYRNRAMPKNPETLVYEVEVIDVTPAPPMPTDVAGPPAGAKTLAGPNVPYELLHAGSGAGTPARARAWDTVTFEATSWDATGRMLDTTELRKRAASSIVFREPPIVQRVLAAMTPGERVRFWANADQFASDGRPPPGTPKGSICMELELETIAKPKHDPPPVPADVGKPPADAKSTKLGVYYKVLASGSGAHPTTKDVVSLRYTAWRSDGSLFESTQIRGNDEPVDQPAATGFAGWTDTLTQMAPGDHWRLWIPAQLAYKGAPGKPQGMLVYDVELVGVKTAKRP